ncbi:GNAT family N-acetyltransferase [Halococcus thailandensis]|uniref:GNAT family N-acetyltransferase n=1 Tax=Halococcus thailandensis TaxID=335952 RepID=UPI000677CED4|nr:helix-turn-helix domain-containing GNAT family N-acetyltransferase [Halococcus thailandensis]
MQVSETVDFSHEDRKSIYEYIEDSDDPVAAGDVRESLRLDPGGFRHHVAILKRDGLVTEEGSELRATFEGSDETDEEQFDAEGLTFTIRPAIETDRSGLVGVIRQVAGGKTYTVAESVADIIDHEETVVQQSPVHSRMFFVATVNDEVVGWIHLESPELEKLSHTAELTLGVLEEYQGYGIGGHLLDRGLDWADEKGYEKLYNSIPSTNEEAVEFFEAHGGEVEAVRENHYTYDGEYIDEVMLALEP